MVFFFELFLNFLFEVIIEPILETFDFLRSQEFFTCQFTTFSVAAVFIPHVIINLFDDECLANAEEYGDPDNANLEGRYE